MIYGQDDRVEALTYESESFSARVVESVGALIARNYLIRGPGDSWELAGPSLAEQLGLCYDEPLAGQASLASCTATLVGPDTIVTAGHCVPGSALQDLVFVRGFVLTDEPTTLRTDQVSELRALAVRVDEDIASHSGDDFAFVTLEIATFTALPYLELKSSTAELEIGAPIVVAGHSEGLPLKIEAGGQISDASPANYFEATSDTFIGGSGSPAFDEQGALVGMLVGGSADYIPDETLGCARRRRLSEPGARAELLVRSDVLRRAAQAGRLLPSTSKTSSARAREDAGITSADANATDERRLTLGGNGCSLVNIASPPVSSAALCAGALQLAFLLLARRPGRAGR